MFESDLKKILKNFTIIEVLNNSNQEKGIDIRGYSPEYEKQIIISLCKAPFPFEKKKLQKLFVLDFLKKIDEIDVKDTIHAKIIQDSDYINNIHIEINTNATKTVYCNKRKCNKVIIPETQKLYLTVTLPYVKENLLKKNFWIYEILEGKRETNKIIYADTDKNNGFFLLPDPKWDYYKNHLYLLAIVNNKDLLSLRDLTHDNLPLLENIKSVCSNLICNGFHYNEQLIKLSSTKIRFFIHYVPSYWHLHIHIVSTDYGYKGMSINEAHYLDDVIHNIKLDSNYYKNKTINFIECTKSKLIKNLLAESKKNNK